MKKTILTSIMTLAFLVNANGQQWIEDTSCNKNASKIVNEAITSLSNLEHLMAVGMAKAALVVDDNCECAKLVLAAAAHWNEDWGSRSENSLPFVEPFRPQAPFAFVDFLGVYKP